MNSARPRLSEKFDDIFRAVSPHTALALAVSGGADSMALMYLIADWCSERGDEAPSVTVLTVDHDLRPEAANEARFVKETASALGFEAKVLKWLGDKPQANVQEEARHARYALMLQYCRDHGQSALLTAHHQDDQAETLLMRLARGSGVDGLSAIAEKNVMSGIEVIRPLIDIPKSELRQFLSENDRKWVEDPSNQDREYERVRLRETTEVLKSRGIGPDALGLTSKRMRRAKLALDNAAFDYLKCSAKFYDAGYATLEHSAFCSLDEEIALRVLAKTLRAVGAGARPAQLSKLEETYKQLVTNKEKAATLARCHLQIQEKTLTIVREVRASATADLCLAPGESALWDRRFRVTAPTGEYKNIVVRFLTREGHRKLSQQCDIETALPTIAIPSLVSFWVANDLLSVPHLNYVNEDAARSEGIARNAEFCAENLHAGWKQPGAGFV